MINLDDRYETLLKEIKDQALFKPDLALVLGSGLGDFANSVNTKLSISTKSLTDYPESTVEGHEGFIHFSHYQGKNLLLFQGRIHFYEGYKIQECLLPVHIAHYLSCENLIITNAAGGVNLNFVPGDLMLIKSVNLINLKKELAELIGIPTPEQRNNLLKFPSETINDIIHKSALDENIHMKEGVYWFGKGPSYETPAEIQMMSKIGIDAVGMSTAHEALYAAHLGMSVSAISCITNYAAGISSEKLDHSDVMETADMVRGKFERLVKRIITYI